MAFPLGSFSDGLFKGAQSIFNLYDSYQGVRRQVALDEIDRKREEDRAKQEALEKQQAGVSEVPGQQGFPGAQQTPAPPGGPGAPAQTTLPAGPVSAKPTESGPTGGEPGPGDVEPGLTPTTTGGARPPSVYPSDATLNRPNGTFRTDNGTLPYGGYDVSTGLPRPQSQMSGSPYNAAGVPGKPGSPSGPAVGVMSQPPTQMSGSPYNAAGVQGAPGSPSGAPVYPPAPVGASLGLGTSPSAWAGRSGITNAPIGATVYPPAQSQMSGTPYNAAGVAGPPGSPSGPPPPYQTMQDPNAPIPRTQPGQPYTPPPQQGAPFNPGNPAVPGGTPGTPGGRVPLAAGPPSLGGRLMGMLNPIGSAQAAEPTGQEQPTSLAYAPPAPVGTAASNTPVQIPPPSQPPPAAPAAPATAQPTALTPAQPPTAGAPAHPPPGPVVVAGTGGTVEQSQATPPLLAPPVDYGALRRAEHAHPDKLALMDKAIQAEGAQGLDRAFMAATIERESQWKSGLTHGTGKNGVVTDAKGLTQVIGDTRDLIDPRHELNPLDDYDSLRLGVRYYKYLATGDSTFGGLGYNTVQAAFAYRAGPHRLPDVARMGWDGYAASSVERADQVQNMKTMFPTTQLTTAMVPGGTPEHKPYNVPELVAANAAAGPDGVLEKLQQSGPAGLGDTDRWRGMQSAMEHYLIISGRPEMAGMAQEWVAQVSHQGAVSHLMAADQALLAGDTQGAINHVLKSYAFFPDGAYARAGMDKNGEIWAYKIADGSHGDPISSPLHITHEVLAQKMIELRNPQTYTKVLQDHQKVNAEINLHNAQARWANARPEIETQKAENVGLRTQAAIDKANADIAMKQQQLQHKTEVDKARGERDKDVSGMVKDYYPPGEIPAGTDAEEYARSGSIFKQLIMTPSEGGAGIAAPAAKYFADGLSAGARPGSPTARQFSLQAVTAKDGTPGYAIKNQKGEIVQSIPHAAGEGLKALIGLAGSEPLRAPGVPAPALTPTPLSPARPTGGAPDMMPSVVNPQNTGIGAGAGTYGALQSGYGQDLTGLPRRRVA
jgi:hypothetical protein